MENLRGKKRAVILHLTVSWTAELTAAQPCCCPQSTWVQEEIGLTQGRIIQSGWVNKSIRTIIHAEVHVLKNMLHQETLQPQFKDSHSEYYSSITRKSKQVPLQTDSWNHRIMESAGLEGPHKDQVFAFRLPFPSDNLTVLDLWHQGHTQGH